MNRAVAGLLVCAALWGLVFIGIHELLPELDPLQLITLRFGIAALAFVALLAARSQWRPHVEGRRGWLIVLVAAIAAVPASQLPMIDGQRFVSPPVAALVATFAPAVAAVLAATVQRERIAPRAAAGFAVALAGVVAVVVLGAGSGAQLEATDPLRGSLILLSPIAWAVYTLMSKPLAERHHAVGIVGVIMIVGALTLLPFAPHALDGAMTLSAGGWAWLVFLALGGSAGPWVLWSWSLQSLPVSRTAAFMYLIPVFALFWSGVLLGEPPTVVAIAGGVVILAGVALTQSKARVRV